eukprot:TRINITY_DN11176_c0_g1_i1.p1 TRINITY_DN11176_c0_g1~~TRINITY_DN11176_c0_g1_i1.p1  ORF type:complete len:123 (-),score=12.20 TRINITY_DN11176_c0_g1_i1:264-632(-)
MKRGLRPWVGVWVDFYLSAFLVRGKRVCKAEGTKKPNNTTHSQNKVTPTANQTHAFPTVQIIGQTRTKSNSWPFVFFVCFCCCFCFAATGSQQRIATHRNQGTGHWPHIGVATFLSSTVCFF